MLEHNLELKFCSPEARVRLIDLYYDAIGNEAADHRHEILRFQGAIAGDPILFQPISVQELILRAIHAMGGNQAE